ncbi:MAG: IclR family transcriptional regulator [Rhodocyclaceae bacterium]|nr:IclR family transcriptional regulator [Rhodocyclaceae bacterium]
MRKPLARELPKAAVPSVLRAARVLDELAASGIALTLGELAGRLRLPKSSTLGLCTSLTLCGLLKRNDDGSYQLGAHLVDLAYAYLSRTSLAREFEQALAEHPELVEEGAVLAVRDGREVVYVAYRSGTQPLGVNYRIGLRLPAHCTATGKAMLSTLSDTEIRTLFRGHGLSCLTPRTHRTLKSLLADLADTRARGYAIDDEETREGMICIGVPIIDPQSSQAIAAVAVSMLKGGVTASRQKQLIQTLQELARLLLHRIVMLR